MMLLAPRSGSETRSRLQHKALELREQTVGTVKGTVEKVSSRTRDLAGEMKEKAGGLENQGRDVLARQLDKVAANAGKAIKPESGSPPLFPTAGRWLTSARFISLSMSLAFRSRVVSNGIIRTPVLPCNFAFSPLSSLCPRPQPAALS
jgi:hypothetical protein